ncbi:MAG: hypothetical protein BAJATHORv1_60134 [Candidatus Thorarchaeota archaeon]|nr:MAG: hypothetical protein BAJATHORv1_60134 [Candidatus Thorarchaeota archaeon]
MKKLHGQILVAMVAMLLIFQIGSITPNLVPSQYIGSQPEDSRIVDIGNGDTIEIAPNEELHKYVLTEDGWVEVNATSSPLIGSEYGNRSDTWNDRSMSYFTDNTTTTDTIQIPTGSGWESYNVQAEISGLTENRTWYLNPGFTGSATSWTLDETGAGGGYSIPYSTWMDDGHETDDDCVKFELNSSSSSAPYFYDSGDRAYAEQSVTIDRGDVVWAGLSLDYFADTYDDVSYDLSGSFSIYAMIEDTDPTNSVWALAFGDIAAEAQWFSSGLVSVPTTIFTDNTITLQVGLWCTDTVGYDPEIGPNARMDNIHLYLKTKVSPSEINLQMNGLDVNDGATRGVGTITQTPTTPWTTNPVNLEFSWTPVPTNPDPNEIIIIDFDVDTNLFSRQYDVPTVYQIDQTSYGEFVQIQNATQANFTTYYYADIPDGYVNRYFYNISIPTNRDVYHVATFLNPTVNVTTGVSGGNPGDGYLNVSTYDITNEVGRYRYWRILSSSPNMISDVELEDPTSSLWEQFVNIRAGDDTRFRINVGVEYENSVVNISIYNPDNAFWGSINATVDASGYAISDYMTFAGSNATAGEWTIRAFTDNRADGSIWNSTGYFLRTFTITHDTNLEVVGPSEAIGTWLTNVTYGDLLYVIIQANDIDSSIPVSGGVMPYEIRNSTNDVVLSGSFSDSGNGEYTLVLETSNLPDRGQYYMVMNWSATYYDDTSSVLTINANYDATLTSDQYPGISDRIGNNQSFTVKFRRDAATPTPISGGTLWCNWSAGFTVIDNLDGTYDFELEGTGVALGNYKLLINATAAFVNPVQMYLLIEVREVYNSISYTANQLSIPVGENESFFLTWSEDDGSPITGAGSYIICDWGNHHTLGEDNYTVTETATAGTYEITIFTEDDDTQGANEKWYLVNFTIERPSYQNHSFSIDILVRRHQTLFKFDSPIQQTQYGDNITALVYYEDTDLSLPITNISGNLRISVTSPDVASLEFWVDASTSGDGHYNISIPSDQWGTIGTKSLTISIWWEGSVKYVPGDLTSTVRVKGTDTIVFLEIAPTARYCLQNFSYTVVYRELDTSTRISNSSNHVFLKITSLTAGHSVTQSDFYVVESGTIPGTYQFNLNSSLFVTTGTFKFQLDFMWEAGISPLYENKSLTVTLVVLERPTYIDYTPVESTPYGEIAEFSFTYVDSLSTSEIVNSSNLMISVDEGGISYTLSYDSVEKVFTLLVDTSSLGGIGTHSLHMTVTWTGLPNYADITSLQFTIEVTLRTTQLSNLAFNSPQWGNNVTIGFVYTDLVSGSSVGMTGDLSLNTSLDGWYDVSYLGDGEYRIVLNSSGFVSDGTYTLNATILYTGSNYAADAIHLFTINVLKRSTQLGYESPDTAPYGTNSTILISYTDDSTGTGISGASIALSCLTSIDTLVLNTNYWVSYLGDGQYQIEINSTALGAPDIYTVQIQVTYSGQPYYLPLSESVNARISERTTQIILTKTPGDTSFLENVTFEFRFEDFFTSENIELNKTHIILTHGPSSLVITSSEYSLYSYGTYYEISFNSTILDSTQLVSSHSISLQINKSTAIPYYDVRTKNTVATTIERPTQILFPSIADTPYGDNITIDFEYVDYLSDVGIDGANVDLTITNLTTPIWYLEILSSGSYQLIIPSEQFGGLGDIYIELTLSKSGIPFYASRTESNIPATIRAIQTSLISEAPGAGTIPVGDPLIVNLTLTDFDHSIPLSGATLTTSWTDLTGLPATITELGDGEYRITLNTTGLVAQEYTFTVAANKQYHATANISIDVQPGSGSVQIILAQTTYYGDWGQTITIRFNVKDTYHGTLVRGMNGSLLLNGSTYYFTDLNNGSYSYNLDSSVVDWGIYKPQITVSREYYQTRQTTFSLVISKATGYIEPSSTLLSVVANTTGSYYIYLFDATNNQPIQSATVEAEWNDTITMLTFNGTAGFYLGSVNVSGFGYGQYSLILSASSINHDILNTEIVISVDPIPSKLTLLTDLADLTVFYGDSIVLEFIFNDTYYDVSIDDALISYEVGVSVGVLTQQIDGSYSSTIDTSLLSAKTYYISITATKTGYSTSKRTLSLTVRPHLTDLTTSDSLQSGYTGQNVTYVVYFNDTYANQPISNGTVIVSWVGPDATITDLQNGSYLIDIHLNLTLPQFYDITVSIGKENFQTAGILLAVTIIPTEAIIHGPDEFSTPINETNTMYFNVTNSLTGELITDLNGIAVWSDIGQVSLEVVGQNYALAIPDDLILGTYQVEIAFQTEIYAISTKTVFISVDLIRTNLTASQTRIQTSPGSVIIIEIQYYDLDHQVGISGVEPDLSFNEGNVTYYPDRTQETEPGVYKLYFQVNVGRSFTIRISMSRENYVTQSIEIEIISDISAEQALLQTAQVVGGFSFIFIALGLVYYVRIYSVPKIIRVLNGMISSVRKGKIPRPYPASSRKDLVMNILSDEFKHTTITIDADRVQDPPIVIDVPEMNELLDRLTEITGLGESDLEAFKLDLARMRVSERIGFLKEVIAQEEARRAEALAETRPSEVPTVPEVTEPIGEAPEKLEETELMEPEAKEVAAEPEPKPKRPKTLGEQPEVLEEFRKKLLQKGIAQEEIAIILEQAQDLSKADMEALLKSLGIDT